MGQKKHHRGPAPVPPGNQPSALPQDDRGQPAADAEAGFNNQDPKRRLGNFTGAGEAAYMQPGGRSDANHEVREKGNKRSKDQ